MILPALVFGHSSRRRYRSSENRVGGGPNCAERHCLSRITWVALVGCGEEERDWKKRLLWFQVIGGSWQERQLPVCGWNRASLKLLLIFHVWSPYEQCRFFLSSPVDIHTWSQFTACGRIHSARRGGSLRVDENVVLLPHILGSAETHIDRLFRLELALFLRDNFESCLLDGQKNIISRDA